MVLYAQCLSVSEFLVSRSSRPAFLNFVYAGMAQGWDQAARAHYGFNSVEELEQAWIQYLRSPKPPSQPAAQIASAGATLRKPSLEQVVVRQTAPPAQPLLAIGGPRPVFRGQSPGPEDASVQPFRPTSMNAPHAGQPPRAQPLAPQYRTPQGGAVAPPGRPHC